MYLFGRLCRRNNSVLLRYRFSTKSFHYRSVCAIPENGHYNFPRVFKFRSNSMYADYCSCKLDYDEYTSNIECFLFGSEMYGPNNNFRNILYADSEDEIINKLKLCYEGSEVFDIIEEEGGPRTPQQLVQAILTLRDIYKLRELSVEFSRDNVDQGRENFYDIISSPSFTKLVDGAILNSSCMNLDELGCCILYLFKLHVDQRGIMPFIDEFENKLNGIDRNQVPLSTWERFIIPIKEFRNIWSFYTLSNTLPSIIQHLENCCDINSFGKITVCLQKMVPLLSHSVMDTYINKCDSLFLRRCDTMTKETERVRNILKIVVFLNFKKWKGRYYALLKRLMLSMRGGLKLLCLEELSTLHEIMFSLQEPYQILNEIHEIAWHWSSRFSDITDATRFYYLFFMFPKMKIAEVEDRFKQMEARMKNPLSVKDLEIRLHSFYSTLLNCEMKFSKELSDLYWRRVIDYFKQYPASRCQQKLTWISLRYLHFSLVKRYRSRIFETAMLSWLDEILSADHNKYSYYSPGEFVRLTLLSFYFSKSFVYLANPIYERIMSCIPFLDISGNFIASFILSSTLKKTKTSRQLSKFLHHYINIISALNNNALEYLTQNEELLIENLNFVLRGYNYRDGIKASKLFKIICDSYNRVPFEQLNSKSIRSAVVNFVDSSHLEPEFCDKIVDYCNIEKNVIHSSTSAMVLNYVFTFGYTPRNLETFVDTCTELLERDKEYLPAHVLVKSALALGYYSKLPSHLTDHLFDIKFLENLDTEIHNYSNTSAGKKVRHDFMELNRFVCVDLPNQDIPWFHESYCKEKKTLEARQRNTFHDDVLRTLKEFVTVDNALESEHYSPYYHKIDILLNTNRKGEPINPYLHKPSEIRRIAILLHNRNSFTQYYNGKGRSELNTRQLEMLGYKVVVINKRQWNSMYMAEPLAKENFLYSHIWS